MRNVSIVGLSLVGLVASACSSGNSINGAVGAPTSSLGMQLDRGSIVRGWMSPHAKKRLLYVSLTDSNLVDVYKIPSYALVGQISNGIEAPEGMATDKKGDLYVSNLTANSVTVYPKGATSPSLTLSVPYSPVDVAITKKNTVLVADLGGGVDVYLPGATSRSSRLTYSGFMQSAGVAVDAQNNVYLVGWSSSNKPMAIEFPDLTDTGTNLNLTGLDSPTGILVDAKGKLAVSDDLLPGVNIYPPGSTSPSKTIANTESPDRSAFNKAESLIYVPEASNDAVNFYDYPSGKFVKTLSLSGFVHGAILSPAQRP